MNISVIKIVASDTEAQQFSAHINTVIQPESALRYEVIFVGTVTEEWGPSFATVQDALTAAQYEVICLVNNDLNYFLEPLPDFVLLIASDTADIVVGNRDGGYTKLIRTLAHNFHRSVFDGGLLKVKHDTHSGCKVFKKEILTRIAPVFGHSDYDLEFLTQAAGAGYKIAWLPIRFSDKNRKESVWATIHKTYHKARHTLRFHAAGPILIPLLQSELATHGIGFHFRGKKYVTHTTLSHKHSAIKRTTFAQQLFVLMIAIAVVLLFIANWHLTLMLMISFFTLFHFSDMILNAWMIYKSLFRSQEVRVKHLAIEKYSGEWPKYTVFCPLYKEAHIIPQFVKAMSQLDYPHDKLEIMLILEEDDVDTIKVARDMKLPDFIKIIVTPHSIPKTKPKACNYALLQATGEYAVIYDAEDIPEKLQLKKAVVAFSKADANVRCIQAKLNYYNPHQNFITRLFTAEYSLWFDLILPGYQTIDAPIPLGGTSNHFKTSDLREFEGWDPFNVTEDADLGIRLANMGYKTLVIDSTTMEEACSSFTGWLKQRSRWLKGYMQTYLVHMREPIKNIRNGSARKILYLQIMIGGKIFSMFVNPFMWIMTFVYFVLRVYVSDFIQSLFWEPIFYLAILSLLIGNFLFIYYYMIALCKRSIWELTKFGLLAPIYWIMLSAASYYALWELIVRPHHWNKTQHGLHLIDAKHRKTAERLTV
jgi:glycosyltransferase XagB